MVRRVSSASTFCATPLVRLLLLTLFMGSHLRGNLGAGLSDPDEQERLAEYDEQHRQQSPRQHQRDVRQVAFEETGGFATYAPAPSSTGNNEQTWSWDATHAPTQGSGARWHHPPAPRKRTAGWDSTYVPSLDEAWDSTYYPAGGQDDEPAPHIVMVVIDDMGFGDMGFKGSGIKTPTLDALAKYNTLLTNYYVLPACTHTRVAFMTGKYPYRNGIYKTVNPRDTWGMRAADFTMANAMRERGYQAHAIGKWHLGHAWYDYLPTYRGFQSFFGTWFNQNYFNYSYRSPEMSDVYTVKWDPHEFCDLNCTQMPNVKGIYSSTLYTDRAVNRIKTFKPNKKGRPLFLYLAYQGVHEPYQVPGEYMRPYKEAYRHKWTSAKITYAGMLAAVDQGISEVIQALKSNRMWNNTLLVVTTDNGAPIGDSFGGSNRPLSGKKGQVWEGGIRADAILAGGAREKLGIPAGTNPNLFHAVDWLPTLAGLVDFSQGSYPRSANWTTIDGVSQVRSLRGGTANRREAYLGYESPKNVVTAYRMGDLKLLRLSGNRYELYNLTSDIGETTDLSRNPAHNEAVGHMKRMIREYENEFQSEPDKIGYCPKMTTDLTPWGQRAFFTWCEVNRKQRKDLHRGAEGWGE